MNCELKKHEVLREVFQAFSFYNSLIIRNLRKTTGGLEKKIEISTTYQGQTNETIDEIKENRSPSLYKSALFKGIIKFINVVITSRGSRLRREILQI